jgi:D-arabinose 1-dehydrogenase
VLSYSHLNLQNASLLAFEPAPRARARVGAVLTASPLNMGLLTPSVPGWHPAPPALRDAARAAAERCRDSRGGLPAVAVGYAVRAAEGAAVPMPTVVGLSKPDEVHTAVRAWRDVREGRDAGGLQEAADGAIAVFEEIGMKDWTWASGVEPVSGDRSQTGEL